MYLQKISHDQVARTLVSVGRAWMYDQIVKEAVLEYYRMLHRLRLRCPIECTR